MVSEIVRIFCIASEIALVGTSLGRVVRFDDDNPIRLAAFALYAWVIAAIVGHTLHLHDPITLPLMINVIGSLMGWVYIYKVYKPRSVRSNRDAPADYRQ